MSTNKNRFELRTNQHGQYFYDTYEDRVLITEDILRILNMWENSLRLRMSEYSFYRNQGKPK